MAVEIKEMVIKTSVGSQKKQAGETDLCNDLIKIKKDIIKECLEIFKDHQERITQR